MCTVASKILQRFMNLLSVPIVSHWKHCNAVNGYNGSVDVVNPVEDCFLGF